METPKKRLDISDWVENQNKDFAPSSLARYLEQPESPGTTSSSSPNETSPRWESSAAPSPNSTNSSSLLSPSVLKQLSSQYAKGELVAVRCNQHKWLLGEVKRLSPRGIRVWVGEAGLLVNVPKQLLSTHLLKMSSVEGLHSLPPGESMISTATMEHQSRYLVQCVRPAHLSHRQLYLPSKRNTCAICREAVILEDEAVAPWDCEHNCHIDCIQDKPRFFSTTTCPICAEQQQSPSSSTASSSPNSPATATATATEEETSYQPNPVVAAATTTVLSARKLQTIDENTPELLTPVPKVLKSALKKQQTFDGTTTTTMVRNKVEGNSAASNSSSSAAAEAASSVPSTSAASSLAERMKKFAIAGASQQQAASATSASASSAPALALDKWVTVIKDGHNTRHTVSQQQFEHMAKAKENTFSSKAAKKQME